METGGHWKLKGDALDGTVWRNRFGRVYGPIIRHNDVGTYRLVAYFRSRSVAGRFRYRVAFCSNFQTHSVSYAMGTQVLYQAQRDSSVKLHLVPN